MLLQVCGYNEIHMEKGQYSCLILCVYAFACVRACTCWCKRVCQWEREREMSWETFLWPVVLSVFIPKKEEDNGYKVSHTALVRFYCYHIPGIKLKLNFCELQKKLRWCQFLSTRCKDYTTVLSTVTPHCIILNLLAPELNSWHALKGMSI